MTSEPKADPLERDLERVRAAFRAAELDDEPSPAVDAAILAAAANARSRRLHGLLPSLALAATVVLALGLVLRLAVPMLGPAQDVAATRDADVGSRAREVESLSSQAIDNTAEARRERAASAGNGRVADETAPAAAAIPQAAPEEVTVFSRTPNAAAPTDSALEAGAASRAIEGLVAPASGCDTVLHADADGWLACIAMLIDAGDVAAARAELDAFTASYPERAVPASVTERLAP